MLADDGDHRRQDDVSVGIRLEVRDVRIGLLLTLTLTLTLTLCCASENLLVRFDVGNLLQC